MSSYVGMTIMLKKKNRDKMIFSINKAYFSHLLAYIRLVMWKVCFVD